MVQAPARRSLPNQDATTATRLRFGHSAWRASREASTSVPRWNWKRLAGFVVPSPPSSLTGAGSRPNSVEPGMRSTARIIPASPSTGRTTSKANCGTRLP